METNKKYEDKALRDIMHRRAASANHKPLSEDFTNRLMQRIHKDVKKKRMQKRRQAWIYSGIAAAVAMLLFLGFFFYRSSHPEKSDFIAKTDTVKTAPQTESKQVEEPPQRKEVLEEKADTINKIKEIHKTNRPPKRYMAKNILSPKKADSLKTMEAGHVRRSGASVPLVFADVDEAFRGHGAEKNQVTLLEELDYEDLKREIQQRGERLNQDFEIAVIDELE